MNSPFHPAGYIPLTAEAILRELREIDLAAAREIEFIADCQEKRRALPMPEETQPADWTPHPV
jgi:hypothetical protein